MNLTEITTQLKTEMENLEKEHRKLLQDLTSMTAKDKALTYEIAQKEMKLEKINQTLLKSQNQLEENNLRMLREKEKLQKERDLQIRKLETELSEKRKGFDDDIAERVVRVEKAEKEIAEREKDSAIKGSALLRLEEDLASFQFSLDQREDILTKKERDSYEKILGEEVTIKDRERAVSSRESESLKVKKNLEERLGDIKKSERLCAEREDYTLVTSQKVEEQSKKLSELIDTYERRLAAFAEKEKLLKIRDLRLADRESLAASRGSL